MTIPVEVHTTRTNPFDEDLRTNGGRNTVMDEDQIPGPLQSSKRAHQQKKQKKRRDVDDGNSSHDNRGDHLGGKSKDDSSSFL